MVYYGTGHDRAKAQTIRMVAADGTSCTESIVVHIATKSDLIQSWERVMEWLPDVADAIYDNIPKPSSKIRFGARKRAVRNDEKPYGRPHRKAYTYGKRHSVA